MNMPLLRHTMVRAGIAAFLFAACSEPVDEEAGYGTPREGARSPSGTSTPIPNGADGPSTMPGSTSDGGKPNGNPMASDAGAAVDGATPSPNPNPNPNPTATLPRMSKAVVDRAIAASLSSYHRNASTGDIWCLPCDGAPIVLATAAFAGDTTADARLLQQMREVLGNSKDPFATGGYAANDERNVTAMFALAKRTPRIWSQLTSAEIAKIDLIMKATLVADVYATADATNAGGPARTFDGSDNVNRDWNPNYREGMIGAVLVGAEYFGGKAATEALLAAYDHAAFTTELQNNGMVNAYWTFSTYKTNANAPSPQTVQQGIQGYKMHGMDLGQLLDMYVYLADDTFGATVACGLQDGAGIGGAGKIVAGCSGLPNLGAVGMEKEFDSVDAEGARSDASYVRLGLRTNLFNQIVLVAYGDWKTTTASTAALAKVKVGITDFFYKATQGYQSYSHGTDQGLFTCSDMDCVLNEALWTEVLAPAHGL